jgi:hypothetical protein
MGANDHEVGVPRCGMTDDLFLRIAFDNIACRAQAGVGENCFGLRHKAQSLFKMLRG